MTMRTIITDIRKEIKRYPALQRISLNNLRTLCLAKIGLVAPEEWMNVPYEKNSYAPEQLKHKNSWGERYRSLTSSSRILWQFCVGSCYNGKNRPTIPPELSKPIRRSSRNLPNQSGGPAGICQHPNISGRARPEARITKGAAMSLHIAISKDPEIQVAKTVLMPGDPLRAQFIAENFLDNAVRYSEIRNMYGYTGTYKGVPVSVQGSGMGMPSMGIYSWELYQDFGVENIIRVGTAGTFSPDAHVGDMIVALAASTDSNYPNMFDIDGYYAPSCSYELLVKAQEAAKENGLHFNAGNVFSSDHFYEAKPDWWKAWQSLGVLGVEMEAAALYTNAAYLGKKALAVMTISDHFVTGETATTEERQNNFTDMMKLALEVAIR